MNLDLVCHTLDHPSFVHHFLVNLKRETEEDDVVATEQVSHVKTMKHRDARGSQDVPIVPQQSLMTAVWAGLIVGSTFPDR